MLIANAASVLKATPIKDTTRRTYMRSFMDFVQDTGIQDANQINSKMIRDYVTSLEATRSAQKANQMESAIRLIMRGLDKPLPSERFCKATKTTLPRHFHMAELSKVIPHLEGEALLVFLLAVGMGLSLSEIEGLRVSDVDIERANLQLQRGKIRICDEIIDMVDCHIDYLRHFYPTRTALISPSRNYIYKMLQEAGEKCGLKGLCVQTARNSYIIHLLKKGVPADAVAKIVGIQSIPYGDCVELYSNPD